jgi:hypothetical protein
MSSYHRTNNNFNLKKFNNLNILEHQIEERTLPPKVLAIPFDIRHIYFYVRCLTQVNFHLEFAHEGVDDPSPNQVDALPPCSPKVGAHTNLEGDEEKRM